jgi:DNA-binding CsgD family transcriptional regulator
MATLQGRLATARRYYAEAAGLAEAHRFGGPLRLALAGLTLAHAMLGDAQVAKQTLLRLDGVPDFGFLAPEHCLADAWTATASQRPKDAVGVLRAAADRAALTGHRITESWLLHDMMRTAGVDTSARLHELARLSDSPLVAARARHAFAARAYDGVKLAAAAADFESLGAMLLAAEAASAAAEAFIRAGDTRQATAAQRRSTALASLCEGAMTPGLLRAAVPVPLSARERDVVMLAVNGMPSKDIADRLYLSVRTVNNHLQHAYTKLGVSSRADLAQALGGSQ